MAVPRSTPDFDEELSPDLLSSSILLFWIILVSNVLSFSGDIRPLQAHVIEARVCSSILQHVATIFTEPR